MTYYIWQVNKVKSVRQMNNIKIKKNFSVTLLECILKKAMPWEYMAFEVGNKMKLSFVLTNCSFTFVGYFIFISAASLGWRRVSTKPKAIKFERKRKRFLKQICQVCGKANNRAFIFTKNLLPLVASS